MSSEVSISISSDMFATKSPCPDNHHQVSTMKEEILATMKYITF